MEKKMLILYYSVSNGNTKQIAERLQEATGADIAQIETVKPYSGSCNDIVEQEQWEVNQGYQPEIKPLALNPADGYSGFVFVDKDCNPLVAMH